MWQSDISPYIMKIYRCQISHVKHMGHFDKSNMVNLGHMPIQQDMWLQVQRFVSCETTFTHTEKQTL